MDFKNAPKKRTTNFREDETKLLIQLWGSPVVQNKLYLTHRKAPVMRLIASNMQKYGFHRTPDEIKTRIRNLKCLYHRIKKSMTTGTGIGTVDPDWPHYKAMDEILSKKNALRQSLVYNHNLLSEVNAEIKEEIEDIEINDDGESYTSNSNGSDEEFDETPSALPATITPLIIEEDDKVISPIKIAPKPLSPATHQTTNFPRIQVKQNLMNTPQVTQKNSKILPQVQTVQISRSDVIKSQPITTNGVAKGNTPLPFPLLILNPGNGVQSGQNGAAGLLQKPAQNNSHNNNNINAVFNHEVSNILKEMLRVQKENLEIERERLEVERQKMEYERAVGCQLLNMVPAFNEAFQRFTSKDPQQLPTMEEEFEDTKHFAEHPIFGRTQAQKKSADSPLEQLRSNKIFKDAVINGIKKYMQDEVSPNSEANAEVG